MSTRPFSFDRAVVMALTVLLAAGCGNGGGSTTATTAPDGGSSAVCGNDRVETGEECDDGNTAGRDGCSANCMVEPAGCGDGVLDRDGGEECDDGNARDGDGCSSACRRETGPDCGNGRRDEGEECDDGNVGDGDGCSSACTVEGTPESCGDGVVNSDAGEECDDGDGNSDSVPGACRTDCKRAGCGDGVIDAGEECDDGTANHDARADACRTDCTEPVCGDGVADSDEACDDGNDVDTDGCRNDCSLAACGDGVVHAGEEACDDGAGNSDSTPDACRTDCAAPDCGDGVTDSGEGCDDGNDVDTDACRNTCVQATCGDDIEQAGEQCDDGVHNSDTAADACRTNCTHPRCGDGVADTGEQCDDGAANDTDGCVSGCMMAECGDGFIQDGVEACDDGAGNSDIEADACRADCSAPRCGDGAIDTGEMCDDGNDVDGDGCDTNCTATGCGNQVVTAPESCDDGNFAAGDGCDPTCREEFCGDDAINNDGTEQCDDGNEASGDCCSGGCRIEAGCELEANNNVLTANDLDAIGINGRIRSFVDPSGDVDFYVFEVAAADAPADLRAETLDGPLGSLCADNDVDSRLTLRDDTGAIVDEDDDGGAGFCSLLEVSGLAAGRYHLIVRASSFAPSATFDYTLHVDVGPIVCGDGRASAPEACDTGDFKGQTCLDFGYVGGELTCSGSCDAIHTDSCTPPTCGDGIAEGFEECDDGNTEDGDGCTASCDVDAVPEVEPNDDGSVSTGGDTTDGNDFATEDANGPFSSNVIVRAAFGVPGDEDVFAITNTGPEPQVVSVETFGGGQFGECPSTDTVIHVRDASGAILATDDEGGVGSCSQLEHPLEPGETLYVHLVEWADDDTGDYFLVLGFRVPVCGDGALDPTEECDDGNDATSDGCTPGCVLDPLAEAEPNEDGSVSTDGDLREGNDFSTDSAEGPFSADVILRAAFDPEGDEDVFALENPGASAITVELETFDGNDFGQCSGVDRPDTVLNVRDATGALRDQDDDDGLSLCSLLTITIPAGETRYLHVTEYGDDRTGEYYLVADFR